MIAEYMLEVSSKKRTCMSFRPFQQRKVSIIFTPGHMGRDVSVLVKGTSEGSVLVAGDLFERCHDEDSWKELSENPQIQEANRQMALQMADVIIPGHGPLFRVQRE
uniref:Metallo-beta-lactamase domain-containing 1 n=1 Tax=Danio rerio TaxID=7955 RepID=A0A0G2KPR2_DANRE|nr:metallo-beta-lactamase domain-containing protein 1 isoform X2 [Danio rerio]|eukprot:XP_021333484.1 metallo-beta-lactamase domain-containing protein 1 isoform X2 [Danio rerio]